MKLSAATLQKLAWSLSGLVAMVAFLAWGQGIDWQFSGLSIYRIFPLLGLIAFSLVWSMYVVGYLRRRFNVKSDELDGYYKVLRFVVVLVIFLHPTLLWWQLWRDGFGLPPESYLQHYVTPALRWVAVLGTLSWFIFLTYELAQKFRLRLWWKYVELAGDLAAAAIFYHGLRLGSNLQHGWFRFLWYLYGLVLLIILFNIYASKLKTSFTQP